MAFKSQDEAQAYWKENVAIMVKLLVVWFLVSFGCGILFVDALNTIQIGGYKLGFWFAQQGSIYSFVILTFVYAKLMATLDRKYGVDDE
jgi:putative solute:sodium symporter small subunit